MREIILASASPRRKKILKLLNVDFKIFESKIDERKFKILHNDPEKYCINLAYKKAENVSKKFSDSIVIGCDTIVYHKNKIIGKPKDKDEAIKCLKSLSNQSHIVFSAISVLVKSLKVKKI